MPLTNKFYRKSAVAYGPCQRWFQTGLFLIALAVWPLLIASIEEFMSFVLVAAFFCGCCLVVYSFSGRRWFSLALITLLFVSVWFGSVMKFGMVAMNLHAYDLIFHLFSAAQLNFFRQTFPVYTAVGFVSLIGLFALLTIFWNCEVKTKSRLFRDSALGLLGISVMAFSGHIIAHRGASFFESNRHIFSAFISSLAEVPKLSSARHHIQMIAQDSGTQILAEPIVCNPGKVSPDIVLTLNESVMPPGIYPEIIFPTETTSFFQSFDQRIHRLRVETFGGGTWLTDFTVLTGISTRMFGNMRNFAAQLMTERLRHSLPQYLKACGYEATVIYTSTASFAGADRFYRSIGFDQIIDRQIHNAPDERQRDSFYLNHVHKVIDTAGKKVNRKPQFIVASTMSNHSPWNFRFAPEEFSGGKATRWNADPEIDEYLWRIVLAKRDREAFRARLLNDFPNQPFLFVSYGDHQPALARLPIANAEEIANTGAWQLEPTSRAFTTYFAIEGQSFTPSINLPVAPIVEAAHLATLTVAAAGLPLDTVYARRFDLFEFCEGLFVTCLDSDVSFTFQKWLVAEGWIAQR